MAKIFELWPQA